MFDKKIFISLGLSFLVAFSSVGSIYHIKQTFKIYNSSEKDYISATDAHQTHDYTTIKSGDFSQSVYSNVRLDGDTCFTDIKYSLNVLKASVSKSAIFYTLHYIQSAISKMLYPFHTFW